MAGGCGNHYTTRTLFVLTVDGILFLDTLLFNGWLLFEGGLYRHECVTPSCLTVHDQGMLRQVELNLSCCQSLFLFVAVSKLSLVFDTCQSHV